MYYLYKKTHLDTGMKYLGKICKDPFTYAGSGKYWLRHLKVHGNHTHTDVIYQTESLEEFKSFATSYSIANNIVESKDWANLMNETGTGGDNPTSRTKEAIQKSLSTRQRNKKTWTQTDETKDLHRQRSKAYWESELAIGRRAQEFIGPPKPPAHIALNAKTVQCPHCEKQGQLRTMLRWHFDVCKKNPNRTHDKGFCPVSCVHCRTTSTTAPNFFRYHGNNCKSIP
jgi:hypothetical protein